MPYINPQIKKHSWFGRNLYHIFDRANKEPEKQIINVKSAICEFAENGTTIHFENGEYEDYDFIVFCTGYIQKFPFLFHSNTKNKDDPLPEEHMICNADEPTLAFIGFVRPNVGAIPPMSEMQTMWWIERKLRPFFAAKTRSVDRKRCHKCANDVISYKLLGQNPRTKKYAVDFGAYMHDLAREIKCAPDLLFTWVWRNPKVAIAYSLGQSYVTFFRLEGPFKCKKAIEVSQNELYTPVIKRGIIGNSIFVAIIILFGIINFSFWCLDVLFVGPSKLFYSFVKRLLQMP